MSDAVVAEAAVAAVRLLHVQDHAALETEERVAIQQIYMINKMVIIYWTCGGVAKVAIIVIVRSQMDQTNHLATSRKFDFPEI